MAEIHDVNNLNEAMNDNKKTFLEEVAMSKKEAQKFYDELIEKGEQDAWVSKSAEEVGRLIEQQSLSFTIEELKEVIKDNISSQELSLEELDLVAGGGNFANCSGSYYNSDCAATVESSSWCASNDWCRIWDVTYNCADSSTDDMSWG